MNDVSILEQARQKLPAELAERLQSLTAGKERWVAVLDVAALGGAERDAAMGDVRAAILSLAGAPGDVQIIATSERTAPASMHKPVMIAVGSGKGGVGKSTLTANLAVALAKSGVSVGVVDADIYGPSQPMLFGTTGEKPEARDEKLVPIASEHGVSLLSMGHLVAQGKALAWRGPMAGKALAQLIDAHWDADVVLVDLPPGTGDVQISMLQHFRPDGAIIVSTPQDLALIDAVRAGQLFDQGDIPIIGLVENMASYVCPNCGEVSDPFGSGGIEAAAERLDLPFLGRIPLSIAIRKDSDAGSPPALGDTPDGRAFAAIAQKLAAWLDKRG
ncbi:P-loop NTPase [Altererythrobacter aurantiacus]|uniref:Iron-sulfur cluster carrier protein n=1 Tax=Parapontixanthobacter aurantiacus TaxID=1463599 RepID=A0A844ZIY1_9SPHN|nr:Mrp/NBP35 family ATP-binding protein [Parapontixanthobacter aurantiacus]MXO86950.1 P-loop NTPase [Parapontixanthobacter aurantiacus]